MTFRPTRSRVFAAALFVFTLLLDRESVAQPVGPELRVSPGGAYPDVASTGNSSFTVVWVTTDDQYDIAGRRVDLSGGAVSAVFRVNTYTSGHQGAAAVAGRNTGEFVVVWAGSGEDAISGVFSQDGIFGQRFGGNGAPLGGPFHVNASTNKAVGQTTVDADDASGFVVTWQNQPAGELNVLARRYAWSGSPLGAEFRVNTYTSGNQSTPSISVSAAGFVVVWQSSQPGDAGVGIFGQRFAATGAPMGPEFHVNGPTTGNQVRPSVAMLPAGGFVVVFDSEGGDGNDVGIRSRRYDSSGSSLGPDTQVNTYENGYQATPHVTADANGTYLVVWLSRVTTPIEIRARLHTPLGAALADEERVDDVQTAQDVELAVSASGSKGRFLVAWQRLGAPHTIWVRSYAVVGDANGDGVLSVADVLYLINRLFAGGPAPAGVADVNADQSVDVSDVLYLINYLFAGGPAPI